MALTEARATTMPTGRCPLWVISGHSKCSLGMSAFGPKADLVMRAFESPSSANSGPWPFLSDEVIARCD
jgi:hypothetical protein